MATISNGTTSLVPLLVVGRSWERPSRNRKHDILGSPVPAMSLADAGARKGTVTLLCADSAACAALEALHQASGVLTLTDTETPAYSMRYAVADGGSIRTSLDPETRVRWLLEVDFQEVPA